MVILLISQYENRRIENFSKLDWNKKIDCCCIYQQKRRGLTFSERKDWLFCKKYLILSLCWQQQQLQSWCQVNKWILAMDMVFKYRASSILLDIFILLRSRENFQRNRCNENENIFLFSHKILFKKAQKFELTSRI